MLVDQIIRRIRLVAGRVDLQWQGGTTTRAAVCQELPTALVYGPSIAIDAGAGNQFVVTLTDGVAFAFAAPTNPPGATFGQQITITIVNASGGAAGAGTWNAIFKTDGNVPAIANGKNRTFGFLWNGTNWVETFQSAADVAN